MHSRAILILSVFGLACVIVAGSMAIRLTSASASTGAPDETATEAELQRQPIREVESEGTEFEFIRRESTDVVASPEEPVELSPQDAATADKLEELLRQVHMNFEPDGAGVRTEMISYLADMISIINQHEHLVYRIVIVEPDAELAALRVETLNDVLKLNVLVPGNVHISGRQGYRDARVLVSAI